MKTFSVLSIIAGAQAAPQLLSGLFGGSSGGGSSLLSGLQGLLPAGVNASSENVIGVFSNMLTQGKVPFGPAPQGCANYEVMIARGTAEPGPFGVIVGDPLMAQIKKDMAGQDVRGYAVQYPAMLDSRAGVEDVKKRLQTKSQECPNMKFALVGYSQGGGVVSQAASEIPEQLFKDKVVAVVLYGAGNGEGGGNMMGLGRTVPSYVKAITMANCAPGDMCGKSDPRGVVGHLTYGSQGTNWHARSSQYIKDAFTGKPGGYKLELSPTK